MLQGNEPLHSALDAALVFLRTIKAIVGEVLACEIPCTWGRDYRSMKKMRCTNRWERISGKSMITSIQLSITLASILFKILSDFVTSLKKVKSNTTVPYIELLNCVPAKPNSGLLDLTWCAPATVLPCCCCSNHFATSLLLLQALLANLISFSSFCHLRRARSAKLPFHWPRWLKSGCVRNLQSSRL